MAFAVQTADDDDALTIDLIGQDVVARFLGVTSQAISNWFRHELYGLPNPLLVEHGPDAKAGKVWQRFQLAQWGIWYEERTRVEPRACGRTSYGRASFGDYVYVIGQVDGCGPVKIGCSLNPNKRLEAIQTGHPAELCIKLTVPALGYANRLENYLHDKLAKYWMRGEWFQFPEDIDACALVFEHTTQFAV